MEYTDSAVWAKTPKIAKIVLDRQRTALRMFEIFGKAIQHRGHSISPRICYTTSFSRDNFTETEWLYDELGSKSTYNKIYTCGVAFRSIAIATRIRPGGFDILLTKNLVDELVYNEKGNEVLLIKYLKKEA